MRDTYNPYFVSASGCTVVRVVVPWGGGEEVKNEVSSLLRSYPTPES